MPDDFATYAQARWPALVAFLVDEGAEREAAEEQATAGLARFRPRWREVRDDHDLDQQVLAVVTGRADSAQADRFLTSLAAQREVDELPPREPPVAEILDRARAARRRTAKRWGVAAAVLVLLAGGGWLVARQLARPPGVRDAANALPVPWYAAGTLHLADVTVSRPQVVTMVRVIGGAVVTLGRDRVVSLVDHDGRVHRLGTSSAQALVVDRDRALVAWNDDSADQPRLVVYSVRSGKVIYSHRAADSGTAPIAIDQHRVFWRGRGVAGAWPYDTGQASAPVVRSLLDVAAGTTVSQTAAGQLQVVPGFAIVLTLPGFGADLSLDGRWLVTVGSSSNRSPRVYNAVNGARVHLGLAKGLEALGSAFGPADSFVFAVRHADNAHQADDSIRLSESGPILLVQCRPDVQRTCRTLTQVADDAAYPPVLAE